MSLYVDDDIYLRDIIDSDNEYRRLYEWCSNIDVYKYFEQRILSYEEIISKYRKRVGNDVVKTFIIVYKNIEIGLVQYEKMDDEDKKYFKLCFDNIVTIDIFIGDNSFYGLGIGSRVVRFISNYLLSDFDTVLAICQSNNDKSINMCLKCGFKYLKDVDYFDTIGNKTKNTLLYLQ